MENILEKKAKKYVDLCNNKEIRELAYKWVLFQYKIEELNDFIDNKLLNNNIYSILSY